MSILWGGKNKFRVFFFFTESHHTASTNRGYSRKHDGGFYSTWQYKEDNLFSRW